MGATLIPDQKSKGKEKDTVRQCELSWVIQLNLWMEPKVTVDFRPTKTFISRSEQMTPKFLFTIILFDTS